MAIKFGTDGWRAVIGEDYTYDNVRKVHQAFCDVHRRSKNKLVVLGYDRRFSGRLFAQAAAEVLLGNGFKVLMSEDFCPTPCVSWMTQHKKALAGVVITASHNPFQWNGVKFKESYGGSASPEYTAKIEAQILKNDQKKKKIRRISLEEGKKKRLLKYFDPHRDYLKQLAKMVNVSAIRRSGVRVLVDPMHGAGSGFIPKFLGPQALEIHGEENPSFGGVNPEPIASNLKVAATKVIQTRARIGLALDGDADRIGALDEKGNFVNSHQIFSLILRHLITVKKWRGDVVKSISTTEMIDRLARKHGLNLIETPIGFKFICQELRRTRGLMGGEESGGLGIPKHVLERDGILMGLFLLEILAHHKRPLSKIIAGLQKELGPLYFIREDLHLPKDKISRIRVALKNGRFKTAGIAPLARKNFRDGFKYHFEDESWLLIRPSGTEPLLRVYAEAGSVAKAKKLIQAGKNTIRDI